jgi:hypothetical protein
LSRDQKTLSARLIWFAAIWIASVAALGFVAYGIRFMIG